MIENKDSIEEDFDPDTAPDLSRDGWAGEVCQCGCPAGSPASCQAENINHHPAITRCDRSLPCRREGLADTDRRGASRVDQEPVRGRNQGTLLN